MRPSPEDTRRRWLPAFLGAAALAGAAVTHPAAAPNPGREPVLKQIGVPHRYYYGEMYLPQVTSGPSSPAFSPDGKELVFSMQGTLWRTALGSGVAKQLTDGPGYDFQPDWSPDGRSIAFSSYRDDAVELHLLDLETGSSRPLTRTRAVSLEPRFSPDGTRLAFVSTAYEARFHLFVLTLGAGTAEGRMERISDDRDSGLPRYYYSRFDHYLSPAWSPDGREVLYVSNHGRLWGTGGFWRKAAEPGGPEREIRHEETSWKARPDWARDGRRVVYSSYLGRQWNQLWLATADGGEPFQLTYGDFDATEPRFSPEGRRIAYVSNEGGDTDLYTVDLPGAKRQKVEIAERVYRAPVQQLTIVVTGPDDREMPARLNVTGADGRSFAPDDALRHADDNFERARRRFEYGYFHSPGRAALALPAGVYTIEATRGLEFRPVRREVRVQPGAPATVTLGLLRLDDLAARGFHAADMHVHMNYGGHYRMNPRRLRFQMEAEDLALVFNLIVNKEQRVPDVDHFTGRPDPASTVERIILHGEEFHTSYWGHLGLLGLKSHLLLPVYAAYDRTAAASLFPDNGTVAELAREQGGMSGYVHPFDAVPVPELGTRFTPLSADGFGAGDPIGLPIDAALGTLDYLEVMGFSDPLASAEVWHRLLNCGFRIPAGAGTDAMTNYASLRGPVGMNRAYARLEGSPSEEAFLAALKAGRTFVTNGPLLDFRLDGRGLGDEVRKAPGRHRLEAHARLRSMVPIDRLEIVGNGAVVATLPLSQDHTAADTAVPITVERSGWYLLRAWADAPRHPVLDRYPFATTSPIYVSVGDAPVRSPADARFFVAWIDRVTASVEAHRGWNDPAEKETVLVRLRKARALYAAATNL